MKYVKDVHYEEIYKNIRWNIGFYDHPLSGVMNRFGEMHYFVWPYQEDFVSIYELTTIEKIKLRLDHFLFESFVGKHTNYDNGKKTQRYYVRSPKWLHNLCFNLYYNKNFKKIKSFFLSIEKDDV